MRNSLVWKLTIFSLSIAIMVGALMAALFQTTNMPISTVLGLKEPIFLPKISEGILYTILVVTVTELLMGYILVRTLIRPLRALTQATQNISMGKLDHEVQVTSRDEIGMLATTFNRMAMNLRENQKALEALRLAAAAPSISEASRREVEAAYFILERQMQETKALENQLREQAIRDPLTNCYNRRYLEETLEREFARAAREKYTVSLVMVDIDNFKRVNDTYGHTAGDKVLKGVSRRLQQLIRDSDILCRYGGEEFLIVLPNLEIESAHRRAEEWRKAVQNLSFAVQPSLSEQSHEEAALKAAYQIQITVSIGIACFSPNGIQKEQVIAHADRALYRAKNDGRNRVEVFDGKTCVPC